MWNRIRDFIRVFFAKSRKIEDEPINKVSLIVIIIIDLFILGNVFYGLDDISRWRYLLLRLILVINLGKIIKKTLLPQTTINSFGILLVKIKTHYLLTL